MRASRHLYPIVVGVSLWCAEATLAHASDDGPTADFFAPATMGQPPEIARPSPDRAHPSPAPFGSPGQLVFGGGSSVFISSAEYTANKASDLDLSFSPAVDYFVFKGVSIGVDVDLEYSSDQSYVAGNNLVRTHTSTVTAGPRLGINLPLGDIASLWPRLTVGFGSVHRDERVVSGSPFAAAPATTLAGPTLEAFVPVLFFPTPHLFLGAGPSVSHAFGPPQGAPGIGGQRTELGGSLIVGGYLGGATPESTPAPGAAYVSRRFGEAHELVVTNEEAVASGSYTSYAGSDASVEIVTIGLGADYFLVNHVSIGLVVNGGYSRQTAPTATGATVTDSGWSFAAGPRVGVDLPLGRLLSIYPRAALTLGPGAATETLKTITSQSSDADLALSVSLPLLVHPASHFFVGAGPALTRDLWRRISFPIAPGLVDDATTLEVLMLIGGWL
jgi:hypothetical protein